MAVDEILEFTESDNSKFIEVKIVDDNEWEPDEDFLIELYDPSTMEILNGKDAETRVTIIDDDEPGILSFSQRTIKANYKTKKARVNVLRQHGCDGTVKVNFKCEDSKNPGQPTAEKFTHYLSKAGSIEF